MLIYNSLEKKLLKNHYKLINAKVTQKQKFGSFTISIFTTSYYRLL